MRHDLNYFLANCPEAVAGAWENNWNGAIYAFVFPILVRAWDKLAKNEMAEVEKHLRDIFGVTIRVGTVGDKFFYCAEARLKLIGTHVCEDLFERRKLSGLVIKICDRVKNSLVDLVYGVGSDELYKTQAYINAYPHRPPPPSLPPPSLPPPSLPPPTLPPPSLPPSLPSVEPKETDDSSPVFPSRVFIRLKRCASSSGLQLAVASNNASNITPSTDVHTDVEESDEETETETETETIDATLTPVLAPIRDNLFDTLFDTDDEADTAVDALAPQEETATITVAMKVPMYQRYMLHLGNTKRIRIGSMLALPVLLTPTEYADLRATFPLFENTLGDGWWRSAV